MFVMPDVRAVFERRVHQDTVEARNGVCAVLQKIPLTDIGVFSDIIMVRLSFQVQPRKQKNWHKSYQSIWAEFVPVVCQFFM